MTSLSNLPLRWGLYRRRTLCTHGCNIRRTSPPVSQEQPHQITERWKPPKVPRPPAVVASTSVACTALQEVAARDLHRTIYGDKELRRLYHVLTGLSMDDRASRASTAEAPSIAMPSINGLWRRRRQLVVDLPARVVSKLVRQRLLAPALARRAFSIILASWRRGQRAQGAGAVNCLRIRLNLLLKLRVQSGRISKVNRSGS